MDARLQNLCASMCPCVTEWSTSAAALVINEETTWEYLPSWWTASPHEVVCGFFTPLICTLSLIHSRRADWLSAARVQRDTVFISLAFRVRLWSVSCWLRVNMQHLITSLGFCLRGHKGPMYHWVTQEQRRNWCEADWIQFKKLLTSILLSWDCCSFLNQHIKPLEQSSQSELSNESADLRVLNAWSHRNIDCITGFL